MKTEREAGGYARQVIRLMGSFQINGTSTPDVIRDGKSALIKSVVRDSAGLFTVTLNDHGTLPSLMITERAWASPKSSPVKVVDAGVVVGSYSQSTRSFQIQTNVIADTGASSYTDPAVGDPDDNSRINFELVGSLTSAGTDAA
jgi:hypothetical protein